MVKHTHLILMEVLAQPDYESQNMLITNTMPKLNNNNLQSKSIFELLEVSIYLNLQKY